MQSDILYHALLAIFVAAWFYKVGYRIVRQIRRQKRFTWLVATSALAILIGAGTMFATILIARGAITLPNSFEWPPGDVPGVVETSNGKYLVPIASIRRLQIYDSNWHFLREWQIDSRGGDFTVDYSPDNEILVFTLPARSRYGSTESGRRYAFTETGKLISEMTLPNSFVVNSGEYTSVPTWRLLWIFSSPFLCWSFLLIGLAGLWAADKLYHRKPKTNTNHSV